MDNNSNDNNFGDFGTVAHSAALVFKGPSIYKQINLLRNLAKWRYIEIKIQVFITSRKSKAR